MCIAEWFQRVCSVEARETPPTCTIGRTDGRTIPQPQDAAEMVSIVITQLRDVQIIDENQR